MSNLRLATVTITRRPQMWQNVVDNILRQTRQPDFVMVVAHGDYGEMDVFWQLPRDRDLRMALIHDPVTASLTAGTLTNLAKNVAAAPARGMDWLCSWDDDDDYGADYLASIEASAVEHPDAWLLGKCEFPARWLGGKRDGIVERDGRAPQADGHTAWLAGPTLCVNAAMWREHSDMRYPDMGVGCDVGFIQQTARVFSALYPDTPPPFYHVVDGEFYLQRYADPAHNHDWKNPRDAA